ncbi:MAG: endopeptidase La [Clostridia bacterium]|nr:endopeptidase La [Clostridia bacterium]
MAVNLVYKEIPTVALRGIVVFPGMRLHFDVGRKKSIEAIKEAMNGDQKIFLLTQKDISVNDPMKDDLYSLGVIASVKQVIKAPEADFMRVVVEGVCRASVDSFSGFSPYITANVREKKSKSIKNIDNAETEALIRKVKDAFDEYLQAMSRDVEDIAARVFFSENPSEIADIIAGNTIHNFKERQELLEELNPVLRLHMLYGMLVNEVNVLKIENDIEDKVESQMEKNQREYYLREKIKTISEELGEHEDSLSEIQKYREKISKLQCGDEVRLKLSSECDKLSKLQSGGADASIIRTYLDSALSLPFGSYSEDCLDIDKARYILDEDHFGLKKIKERFIEMLAVKKRSENLKGNIICLVGPPGVGKTSIVRSVAKAMNRKYVRLSLGGVSDEAEIRGHRKTYVGAMQGRIVNALIQAKTFNPIILLDEIDKLGKDYKGDPASAMLEVLDPEQNFSFRDNYMEFPIDLSKVLFITTANDVSTIPQPLYDRMEIIELTSYTPEEKFHIAKNHLIKKQMKMHELTGKEIRFSEAAIRMMIDSYTRESGVRRLEQIIASVCRKSVVKLSDGKVKRVTVTCELIKDFLGPEKYQKDKLPQKDSVGVVNGLAWTSAGGEMLQVECVIMDGNGQLELTGSLGEIMKESAKAAFSYIKSTAEKYGIDVSSLNKKNIHIHVPQGAVPKDGPSAGVTIATALLSVLTGKNVNRKIAMTGEITLTGRVLPIGGLKEKSMAAYKSGIKKVIIPEDNLSDLWDIDDVIKENVEFIGVSRLDDVFGLAIKGISFTEAKSNVKFSPHDVVIKSRKGETDEIR